jgi:hypothetical protein
MHTSLSSSTQTFAVQVEKSSQVAVGSAHDCPSAMTTGHMPTIEQLPTRQRTRSPQASPPETHVTAPHVALWPQPRPDAQSVSTWQESPASPGAAQVLARHPAGGVQSPAAVHACPTANVG